MSLGVAIARPAASATIILHISDDLPQATRPKGPLYGDRVGARLLDPTSLLEPTNFSLFVSNEFLLRINEEIPHQWLFSGLQPAPHEPKQPLGYYWSLAPDKRLAV